MENPIAIGLEHAKTYKIGEADCTGHTGTPVLSTPAMVMMIEGVCGEAAAAHLGPTETTVGIHICVSHVAGSQLGEEVVVKAKLADIKKDRFLTFDVTANVGERLLGQGTHQRAVLDTARMK